MRRLPLIALVAMASLPTSAEVPFLDGGHVKARAAQVGTRQNLDAGNPLGPFAPHGFDAQQVQGHGEFLARRAHGG